MRLRFLLINRFMVQTHNINLLSVREILTLNHQGKHLIQFVNARLNQQPLGYIETYVDFSKPVKTVNAYLQPDCQNCLLTFKFSHKEEKCGQFFR